MGSGTCCDTPVPPVSDGSWTDRMLILPDNKRRYPDEGVDAVDPSDAQDTE